MKNFNQYGRFISIGIIIAIALSLISVTFIVLAFTGVINISHSDINNSNISEKVTSNEMANDETVSPVTRQQRRLVLEKILVELPRNTLWSKTTESRLKSEIAQYAALNNGSPFIVSLQCSGQYLCKLVLDHKNGKMAQENLKKEIRGGPYSWRGPRSSFGGGENGVNADGDRIETGQFIQTLFLIEKGYNFNGFEIVSDEKLPDH